VINALKKIHNNRILRRILRLKPGYFDTLKHDLYIDVPESEKGKPILATVRNPYDRYVALFYYRWWATHPEEKFNDISEVKRIYPHFPEVSFDEYVKFSNTLKKRLTVPGLDIEDEKGYLTQTFIKCYFSDPQKAYEKAGPEYIESREYLRDMGKVDFIHTENINVELYEYLLKKGHKERKIRFILEMDRIRPVGEGKTRPDYNWKKHYTPKLRKYVREKEDLLFRLFPEYDVDF